MTLLADDLMTDDELEEWFVGQSLETGDISDLEGLLEALLAECDPVPRVTQ